MVNRTLLSTAVAAAALSALAVPAGATNLLGSTSSAIISGTTFGFGPSAMPWTAEVWSPPGVCLRIAVLAQATDLEATVVAPNGTVFRDDDGGGANRPLVKINNTPNNGWYTVSINHWAGAAVSANFTLSLERVPVNSASCLPGTPPSASLQATAPKANRAPTPPAAGQAGH